MNNPFFSILIPCYNAKQYIERALDSCKNQIFNDYEIILCDNNSADGIQELLPNIKIKNFKYFLGKNRVSSIQLRNFLIKQASGKYIIWLQAYDELTQFCLQKSHEIITKNNNVDILQLPTEYRYKDKIFYAQIKRDIDYQNDNCVEIYFNRNDMMQDLFCGKIIKAEILKKIKTDDFDINSGQEVFYTLQMFFNAKKYVAIKTSAIYVYYADINRFTDISELNANCIMKLCKIRNEQLKRNLQFLKSVNYKKSFKYQCLEKLYLSNILNDIFNIQELDERIKVFNKFNEYFNLQIGSNLCGEY